MSLARRKKINTIFHVILVACILFSLIVLIILFTDILKKGFPFLNIDFLTKYSSRFPKKSGIRAGLFGSLWIIITTVIIAFPLGVSGAIYLEEYAPKNRFTSLIKINISNLAGVPSIVYGILGLSLFVRTLKFGRTILSASLTMALLILPIIIVSSQEALKTVPKDLKEASYGLGATKWETITGVILPYSMPGILTGTILAISRAIGEAAPLVVVGGAAAIWFTPKGLMDEFTTLPLQIFTWASKPQADFQLVAAAGITVLLLVLIFINLTAILLRNKYQDRMKM
ncbi:phosphate ABC transporter permease PstA [Paramaledivibacter caminithermalis]|jgi:phosphate transport system permease protein|uniref:Phosphate transport system permease protein PstA n=1 Tax=Paramaledivibacter caminithermalis (strain DSM 15212 / CIP 107654 / DViRD3) TaxID=1121301 RepID=A0A1M6KTC6_PARC5|nr:phosphate ABC transporter permease PstA [Paramaledivibacter caminithermalis]SHJ62218.1 phosphate ABC transporter membrane protein 2, PhoT family (TC 3.A.1.7.1) [Paramaledivibacter caminithermalis DSM 15212]